MIETSLRSPLETSTLKPPITNKTQKFKTNSNELQKTPLSKNIPKRSVSSSTIKPIFQQGFRGPYAQNSLRKPFTRVAKTNPLNVSSSTSTTQSSTSTTQSSTKPKTTSPTALTTTRSTSSTTRSSTTGTTSSTTTKGSPSAKANESSITSHHLVENKQKLLERELKHALFEITESSSPKNSRFSRSGNETSLLPLGPLALESKQFFPKELIRGQQLFEEDVMESKKVKKFEAKVECFNASCSSSTSFQKRCAIFIGSPPLCDVPCHLEGCKIEYHQNIMCTLWACHEKTTTTPGPGPTPGPTPIPTPSSSVEQGLVASVIFNIFFVLGFSLIVGKYYKTRRGNQNSTNQPDQEEDIDDVVDIIRRTTPIFRRQGDPASSERSTPIFRRQGDPASSEAPTQHQQNQDNFDSIDVAPSAPPASQEDDLNASSASAATGAASFLDAEKLKKARKKFAKFWKKKPTVFDNDVENPDNENP